MFYLHYINIFRLLPIGPCVCSLLLSICVLLLCFVVGFVSFVFSLLTDEFLFHVD